MGPVKKFVELVELCLELSNAALSMYWMMGVALASDGCCYTLILGSFGCCNNSNSKFLHMRPVCT